MAVGAGRKVAVLGGGIGGLSAAHHLMRLGFKVDVYERGPEAGGKSLSQAFEVGDRSIPCLGEHGFRFFPNFYTHLTSTLKEIPLSEETAKLFCRDPATEPTVADLLLEAREAGFAWDGTFFRTARPLTRDLMLFADSMRSFLVEAPGTALDKARYAAQVMRFMTSCPERREAEYEQISWLELVGAEDGLRYSSDFVEFIRAIPRTLSAMDGGRASARTVGNVSAQLLFNLDPERNHPAMTDALLCGPSTLAWLRDWVRYLNANEVDFHYNCEVRSLAAKANTLEIARARGFNLASGEEFDIRADFFVGALPLEKMNAVLDASEGVVLLDPQLGDLRTLALAATRATASMVGVQFLLRKRLGFCNGHVFYPRSPFALTSISQGQFWAEGFKRRLSEQFQVPELEDVLSVIVSDWGAVEAFFEGRPMTREGIVEETWHQLTTELPGFLSDKDLIVGRLDSNVQIVDNRAINTTPLLVHPPGTWRLRPHAQTAFENFVLAADYVATNTDLASMEGANEAARAAVAAIARKVSGDPKFPDHIRPLSDGPFLEAAQKLDRQLFHMGRGHAMERGPLRFLRRMPSLETNSARMLLTDVAAREVAADAQLRPIEEIVSDADIERWQNALIGNSSQPSGVAIGK